MGVTKVKSRNKWRARYRLNGETHHVGYFNTKKEAVKALEDHRWEHKLLRVYTETPIPEEQINLREPTLKQRLTKWLKRNQT